jgi:2-desacetyl-2-hydroxyethyl bacteriochlorophyllide A dehydrogenase
VRARVVRFAAPYRIELGEQAVGEPGPGEALIRTEYSGISPGTEMLAYRGELDPELCRDESLPALAGTFRYPFEYGYSVTGIVEDSHGEMATGARVFAFHPHQDRFVVPASELIVLPNEIDLRSSTLFPLVEVALQTTLEVGAAFGHTVVISGLGPVGIITAAVIARTGAHVLASDPLEWRRRVASDFGVCAISPADLPQRLRDETSGRGAEVLVEASGNPHALADGLSLLAHEGLALVCSWYGTKPVTLGLGGAFHRRRLTIRSTQVSTIPAALSGSWSRERRRAATLGILADLPLKLLCTHEFPLARAAEAYAAIDRRDEGLIHVALNHR